MKNKKYQMCWTVESINCYKRGCVCKGCIMKEILECKCRMKETVIELVKQLGTPNQEIYDLKIKYGAYHRR